MDAQKIIFRVHALQRMFQRAISSADVLEVIEGGNVLESRPDDLPYPSRLMLGFPAGRAIHVVVSQDPVTLNLFVVTAYDPDPSQWNKDFRKRLT